MTAHAGNLSLKTADSKTQDALESDKHRACWRSGFFSNQLIPGVVLAALGISFLIYPLRELRLTAHKEKAAHEFGRKERAIANENNNIR
jgi:hypothetical protein